MLQKDKKFVIDIVLNLECLHLEGMQKLTSDILIGYDSVPLKVIGCFQINASPLSISMHEKEAAFTQMLSLTC